jgi:Uma2 family endonuclease
MKTATPDRFDSTDSSVYRLTVDAYHQMIAAGIFHGDDRVELISGELRTMPPISAGHAGKIKRLNRLLSARVGGEALVAVQDPLTLPDHSEPQPDVMLLRPRDDYYERGNPGPADVLLVIEVSDSSLRYDRETKLPLYANSDVPEVWLLDLPARRMEIYRDPGPEGYRQILLPDKSQTVAPTLLKTVAVKVEELWG